MWNWIVRNRTLWPFNCVWINDWCQIEFLVIHSKMCDPFNCVQMNKYSWIELLVLNSNTWNSLTGCLNWIFGII